MILTAIAYLVAVVAANLTITQAGASAVIPVGFVLIGLDLVARDRFHDHLRGTAQLLAGMGGLIAAGGLISYVLNADAARVAAASCAAFVLAAIADAVVYARLEDRDPLVRSAVSNAPAAGVDSYVFLALAFPGAVLLDLVIAQTLSKSLGGLLWSAILYGPRYRTPATLDEAIRRDLGA